MEPASADDRYMARALELAARGEGSVEPNPMVGCVIVRESSVIGEGYHRRFGGPHAEIEALRSIKDGDARGSTAFVTLEPCCHRGKTPPCAAALIDAGVARVVAASEDPFAQVDGGGFQQLRDAGIDVTVGVLRSAARSLLAPYLKCVTTGTPWVIAKWAMSVDGRIATARGESQWITNQLSRQHVHRLRARVDSVVVGMGTVETDDPLLTARLEEGDEPRVATRTVFCRHRLPAIASQLIQTARHTPTLLIAGPAVDAGQLQGLEAEGAIVVRCPQDDPLAMVQEGMAELGRREMTNVMVEGGGELLASFFEAEQIDECHVYIGPKTIGGTQAAGPIGGTGIAQLSEALRWQLQSVEQFENDLRLIYRRTTG